jgi:hypothetical protein
MNRPAAWHWRRAGTWRVPAVVRAAHEAARIHHQDSHRAPKAPVDLGHDARPVVWLLVVGAQQRAEGRAAAGLGHQGRSCGRAMA